jgi:PAS domain-containing protein
LQNAVVYRKENDIVNELLKGNNNVSVICDPALAGELKADVDYKKIAAMLHKLGFNYIHEVAFGADLTAIKYKELYNNFTGKYYISSKCYAVVNFIEKYYPNLVENLAPVVPPYIAMGKVVKKKYGEDTKIVYLTACTAAKDEARTIAEEHKIIDAVITFSELNELFKEKGITAQSVQYREFDTPLGRKGGLFPISHGLLQAVDINQGLLEANVLVTDGKTGLLKSVEEFEKGDLNQHIDSFYCHGCFMGPGMSSKGKKFTRRSKIINYVKRRLDNLNLEQWEEDIKEYSSLNLGREFRAHDRRLPFPSEDAIQHVLDDMGKSDLKDQPSCGACGYPTCREFAIAHLQGLAKFEMCYVYSTKKMQSYLKELTRTNAELEKMRDVLLKSEEKARREEQSAKEASEILKLMLNKIRAGVVIVDENMRIMEANSKFVDMMGDDARLINEIIPGLRNADIKKVVPFFKMFYNVLETNTDIEDRDITFENKFYNLSVFNIKSGKVVGGIIRDMKAPEVRKEEIIKKARDVIKENLKTVQKIAFLLGESAAKTEKTLNSIIEVQKLGEKKNDSR